MKKFTINCDFGGQIAPFSIYVGKPEQGHHPLHFQADWLSKNRGGTIPGEVMDAVSQLQDLANKNGVLLEELCVYALGTQEQQDQLQEETLAEEGGEEGIASAATSNPEEESSSDEDEDEDEDEDDSSEQNADDSEVPPTDESTGEVPVESHEEGVQSDETENSSKQASEGDEDSDVSPQPKPKE